MSSLHQYSQRMYFKYDPVRSTSDSWFYKYVPKKENTNTQYYAIFEAQEITFKKEVYNDKGLLIALPDILVIPKNTLHNNFIDIERQLIRLKYPLTLSLNFPEFLKHFILDFYVYDNFKETGEAQAYKSALEYIPQLQGIVYKTVFTFYTEELEKNKIENIVNENDYHHFLDNYVAYSKFLSNPQNERLYKEGGWFVNKKDKAENRYNVESIDKELNKIEKDKLKLSQKGNSSYDPGPVNIRYILKRYGISDVLSITLGKNISVIFLLLISILIFCILGDILVFNLNVYSEKINDNSDNSLLKLFELGIIISGGFLSVFSGFVLCCLWRTKQINMLPGIFLPRLIIAIISGWLLFFTAEELLKIDIDIDGLLLLLLVIIIPGITLAFMYFEINNYAPAMMKGEVVKRSFIVAGLAFIVSYSFGFWTMSHINQKFMSIDNFVVKESKFYKEFERRTDYYSKYLEEFENKQNEISTKSENLNTALAINNMEFSLSSQRNRNKSSFFKLKEYRIDTMELTKRRSKLLDSASQIVKADNLIYSVGDSLNKKIKLYNELVDVIERFNGKNTTENNAWGKVEIYQRNNSFDGRLTVLDKVKISDSALIATIDALTPTQSLFKDLANKNELVVDGKAYYQRKYQYISRIKQNHFVFPNMLLTRALLAMFIGIFLQLIIQDKTITEPI